MKQHGKAYRFLVFLLSRVFFRVTLEGVEHMPTEGPVLLCANHVSLPDPILIVATTPRLTCFMAKKELFSVPVLRSILKYFGVFPINRGAADVSSLKHSLSLLKEGKMVGIFPQGTRCKGVHPKDTEPKLGTGMIAVRSKATLLPVGISCKKQKVHLFSKITIRIGRPIPPEEYCTDAIGSSEYQRVTDLVFSRICELVPEDASL